MATTKKKSPKAKTKTTKASVTKSAKTTKKSVSTKATKVVKTTSTKNSFTNQLNKLNVLSGVLSLALAAAAGFLMNNTSYQLFTGLLTKDELASKAGTVFVPAVHSVYDLELRWAVVVIMVLAALVPLLAATRNRKQYEASLGKKVMGWRWVEMGIVSALIVETIALLSGVHDITTLKLVAALMLVTAALGWLSEKQSARAAGTGRGVYTLSLFTGTLPWLLIAAYAVATVIYGRVRSPWYVYALYGAVMLGFLGYTRNGMRQLRAQQNYETTERNYLQLSIFVKVAFAVILIVGLYKK